VREREGEWKEKEGEGERAKEKERERLCQYRHTEGKNYSRERGRKTEV
jgi:hypothetical protein